MFVAELSEDPLIPNRSNGKISGKISRPRWRRVRTAERLATASVCSIRLAEPVEVWTGRPSIARSTATASPGLSLHLRLLGGTFELASRLCQEHVVQRRLVELERLDLELRLVEHAHDVRQLRLAARQLHRHGPVTVAAWIAEPRQDLGEPVARVGVARGDLDARAADLRLELRGCALGHDVAVVDDPDPVRQHVRLFEVL